MKFKKQAFLAILLPVAALTAAIALYGSGKVTADRPMQEVVDHALADAASRAKTLYSTIENQPGRFPRSADAAGRTETCDAYFWASGFFPGELWYLYEYTRNEEFRAMAEQMTRRIESQKSDRNSHDTGFKINSSFGNAYRITGDSTYIEPLVTAANSLASRFNEQVGCIRSWSSPFSSKWQFPVIIDNMVTLELLCRASQLTGDDSCLRIAEQHADKTLQNHFRPDFSSYHVVDYDPSTGKVAERCTWQGHNASSSWSRGQAWGLYGFTMMYRETKRTDYLTCAQQIADFIIAHPRLPEDGIPYWDFDAPGIPDVPRDAAAGAITASALIELSRFTDAKRAHTYLALAERQLRTLASETYTAPNGTNGGFILLHGVGFLPAGSEVDVPLSYADYYYVEALMRYRTLLETDS